MQEEITNKSKAWLRIGALILICVTGLLLRSCGLSHDLDADCVYHPDTPKQIYASQLSADGIRYFKVGKIDYDGYPLFNSHLAAGVYNVVKGISNFGSSHLGLPDEVLGDSWKPLFWITRLLNVLLSTLSILVVYKICIKHYGVAEALLASALLMVSPVDIATCHYATGDTTAAFFALLSVFFAGRIYMHGKRVDYILGAVSVAFAFSAKYHGIMAGLPVALAHIMRQRNPREFFSKPSMKQIGIMAAAFLVGFFISTPAMFVDPVITIQDIYRFFGHTSDYGMGSVLKQMTFLKRCMFALRHNMPVFADILSPIALLVIAAGVFTELLKRKKSIIFVSLPFFYVLGGLPFKPLTHAQYHTMATSSFFILVAVILVRISRAKILKRQFLYKVVSSCLFVAMFSTLSIRAHEENFYFSGYDTRRFATEWVKENIPSSFSVVPSRYTYIGEPEAPTAPKGHVFLALTPSQKPHGWMEIEKIRFDIMDKALPSFRNPSIDAYICSSDIIKAGWAMPVFQRYPTEMKTDVVVGGIPVFYRTSKMFSVEVDSEREKHLFSDHRLEDVVVIVKSLSLPAKVKFSSGMSSTRFELEPAESFVLNVDPSEVFLTRYIDKKNNEKQRYVYRFNVSAEMGAVQVLINTTPLEKGVALFNAGKYEMAYPWLEKALAEKENLTIRAMMLLTEKYISGDTGLKEEDIKVLEKLELVVDGDVSLLDEYGISFEYLKNLPFVGFNSDDMKPVSDKKDTIRTDPVVLERGSYIARICWEQMLNVPARISVVDDRTLRRLSSVVLSKWQSADEVILGFDVPAGSQSVRFEVESKTESGVQIDIEPDPVEALERIYQLLLKPENRTDDSHSDSVECNALFDKGVLLKSCRLGGEEVVRGEDIVLNLYWGFKKIDARAKLMAVWIHFIDSAGTTVFQADHNLVDALSIKEEDGLVETSPYRIYVPESVPPGVYKIRVGLYYPLRMRRANLKESVIERRGKGVILGTINVTE